MLYDVFLFLFLPDILKAIVSGKSRSNVWPPTTHNMPFQIAPLLWVRAKWFCWVSLGFQTLIQKPLPFGWLQSKPDMKSFSVEIHFFDIVLSSIYLTTLHHKYNYVFPYCRIHAHYNYQDRLHIDNFDHKKLHHKCSCYQYKHHCLNTSSHLYWQDKSLCCKDNK